MKNSFADKYGPWALITGGTSGIGEAFSHQVAEKGINIILVARRENLLKSKAEELSKKHGVEVKTIQADLSAAHDYKKVIEATKDLDIGLLIPSAGIENHGVMTGIELERELALIQLNITSTFALTHHFARQMVERKKGGVLLIASIVGQMPNPYMSNYSGSKAYIVNLGTSLHWEMKKKGVDVTVLSPGPTSTPMITMMENTGMDINKAPMSALPPEPVAKVGLEGLGKKPLVIPGFRNNMMVFMSKHIMPTSFAISMGGKMMERVMNPSEL